MKLRHSAMGFVLGNLLLQTSLFAHTFRPPEPDEMAAQATLVCNGLVEAITEKTAAAAPLDPHFGLQVNPAPEPSSGPVGECMVTVKVLHSFKGSAAPEISLICLEGLEQTDNGPILMNLRTGKRYRFFLRPGPDGRFYVGALDGSYVEGLAATPLADTEPDDSSFVSKAEAIQLATQYLHEKHPDLAVDLAPEGKMADLGSHPRLQLNIPDTPQVRPHKGWWLYLNGTWTLSLSGSVGFSVVISPDRVVYEKRP
jgi:hypothetical protein